MMKRNASEKNEKPKLHIYDDTKESNFSACYKTIGKPMQREIFEIKRKQSNYSTL